MSRRYNRGPLIDRIFSAVTVGHPMECWPWEGAINAPLPRGGYGVIRVGAATEGLVLVHRAVYEFFHGPIPDGHEVDHLCSIRRCVNPAHLDACDHRENIMRGFARRS